MRRSPEERWGTAASRSQPPEPDMDDQPAPDDAADFAKERLRSFVERIERLEEEKKTIADDIKDVFAEAKGTGFDTKALREILKIRKQDPDQRAEHQAIVDLYLQALGMAPFEETPLGQAAEATHQHATNKQEHEANG